MAPAPLGPLITQPVRSSTRRICWRCTSSSESVDSGSGIAPDEQLTCTYIDSRSIRMQDRQCVISSLALLGHLLLQSCRSNALGADTEQTPNRDRRRKPAAVITRLYAIPDPRVSVCVGSVGWNRAADGTDRRPRLQPFLHSGYCGRGCHHPQVHYIVPAGALLPMVPDGWIPRPAFFLPVRGVGEYLPAIIFIATNYTETNRVRIKL
jgi:hypothetical protein